jgi:hypothetical protein
VTDEELFAALDEVMGEMGSNPSPWPAPSSEPVDLDACGSPAEIGELSRGWSGFRGFFLN